MYLLLYGGQQVFEDGQFGHKVLQLLVSTLIHRLVDRTNKQTSDGWCMGRREKITDNR